MKNENTADAQHGTAAEHLNFKEFKYAGVVLIYGSTTALGRRIEICPYTKLAPAFPGHWSPFCGEIEERETPVETAKRELREETGVEVEARGLKFMSKIRDLALFAYELEDLQNLELNYEHTEYGYFRISQLHNSPNPMDEEMIKTIQLYKILN